MPRPTKVTPVQEYAFYLLLFLFFTTLHHYYATPAYHLLLHFLLLKTFSFTCLTLLAGTTLNALLIDNDSSKVHLPSSKYWFAQRLTILGRGALYVPLLMVLVVLLLRSLGYVWTHLFLCTLLTCGGWASVVLLVEPLINLTIRVYAWQFVGKDAVVQVDFWSGVVAVKHVDVSRQALDLVGKLVLTPSSFRLEHFKLVVPWRNLFRGISLLVSGVKVKLKYVDPLVAMYNVHQSAGGQSREFLTEPLLKERSRIAMQCFQTKQAAMIALANVQTTAILDKLQEVATAKQQAVSRRSQRLAHPITGGSNMHSTSSWRCPLIVPQCRPIALQR